MAMEKWSKSIDNTDEHWRWREEREKIHFQFRYEEAMDGALRVWCQRTGMRYNELVLKALTAFAVRYNQGHISLNRGSDFLARLDKTDKIEVQIIVPRNLKLILCRLAFTFRHSQAEVLRMAIEWYVRGWLLGNRTHYQKNHYIYKKRFPVQYVYNLDNIFIDAKYTNRTWMSRYDE